MLSKDTSRADTSYRFSHREEEFWRSEPQVKRFTANRRLGVMDKTLTCRSIEWCRPNFCTTFGARSISAQSEIFTSGAAL